MVTFSKIIKGAISPPIFCFASASSSFNWVGSVERNGTFTTTPPRTWSGLEIWYTVSKVLPPCGRGPISSRFEFSIDLFNSSTLFLSFRGFAVNPIGFGVSLSLRKLGGFLKKTSLTTLGLINPPDIIEEGGIEIIF